MKIYNAIIIVSLFVLSSCGTVKEVVTTTEDVINQSKEQVYQSAIENAMSPAPDKVYNNLIAINPQNENLTWQTIDGEEYVLMVSWKGNASYYEPYVDSSVYNTGPYEIWVSASPELLTVFSQDEVLDTNLRIKQMLGLPPSSTYNYFVEFWVKPADLFRPCADNEITDQKCDLCFPTPTDSTYINWINSNRVSRYYDCELSNKYPWTQLGYTYDWNVKNLDHVGLSEFVIKPNANIIVEAVYPTAAYLQKSSVKD
ncbi:MAG: hypothetical protein GQ574_09800 [Crocinitomix sp.]|nr:hypothetical protein [Crocinitomix sp.]